MFVSGGRDRQLKLWRVQPSFLRQEPGAGGDEEENIPAAALV